MDKGDEEETKKEKRTCEALEARRMAMCLAMRMAQPMKGMLWFCGGGCKRKIELKLLDRPTGCLTVHRYTNTHTYTHIQIY